MTEIERLRADLEAMERVGGLWVFSDAFRDEYHEQKDRIRDKIARLEAEQADPWREAKKYFDQQRARAKEDDIRLLPLSDAAKHALAYHDHVVAENERLAKENAALGRRFEDVNRELAKCEARNRDFLEEIHDRAFERDQAERLRKMLEAVDSVLVAEPEVKS